ncbi:MAG: hypothetical protein HC884_17605 [Chloroflexaceae bacterium]|nr:hypothetical protein [Chloroflexaceae bacterium]
MMLVHGLGDYKNGMGDLERMFRRCGYATVNWSYASLTHPITILAEQLYQVYRLNAPHYETIHFVTQSMGGIVLRRLLKLHPLPRLGKIVMIGPPNHGASLVRAVLDRPAMRLFFVVPGVRWVFGPALHELGDRAYINEICAIPTSGVMVVAGTKPFDIRNFNSFLSRGVLPEPHDGTIALWETRLPVAAMDRFLEVPETHNLLPSNPLVMAETRRFIAGTSDDLDLSLGETSPVLRQISLVAKVVLGALSRDPQLLSGLPSMPNLAVRPVLPDLAMCWNDLVSVRGWHLQQHTLVGVWRVLDPQGVRQAWGGKDAMLRAFQQVAATVGRDREDGP